MSEKENVLKMFAQGEELLEVLRRGRHFTEELLAENERLRFEMVKFEMANVELKNRCETEVSALRIENSQLKNKGDHLERRFMEVESENRDFAARYVQISQENENMANLYVASYRLHSTLDPSEVTDIIAEILIELVGAEEFGLLLLDERTNELQPLRVEGPFQYYPAHMTLADEPLGTAVRGGKATFAEGAAPGRPLAVIPMQIKGHAVGAIIITKLLHNRTVFDPVGKELLGLLAGHAATALMSANLYSAADRKLRTIEGFMELIKGSARAAATGAGTAAGEGRVSR